MDFKPLCDDFKHMEKIFIPPRTESPAPFSLIMAGITYPDPDYGIYRKCSELYVLEYVVRGRGIVICDENSYDIKEGDAYILPAGAKHRYYSDKNDPWEKKWMNVSGPLCRTLLEMYGISRTVRFPNADAGGLFDDFFEGFGAHAEAGDINGFAALAFHRIVQWLARRPGESVLDPAERARQYINSNIYGKITAASVAAAIGFSVSQAGRLFKKEYKTTIYSYILEQKLCAAEQLIRNSSVSLKEVADMLGFTDEHYFCNIYKKKRGITPGQLRR